MKRIKKLVSLMLAMVMALAMTMTTFASAGEGTPEPTTYKITINNSATGHTYEAYQIFKGTLSKKEVEQEVDGQTETVTIKTLSDIQWGNGISEDGKLALGIAKENAEALQDESLNAADFAQTVSQYLTIPSGTTSTLITDKYEITGLAPGYYLVKDQDDSLTSNDNYTTFILEVVGDAEATPKNTGTPVPDKEVKGKTDWQDSADYDIGDEIEYKLTAELPETVNAYDKYQLIFEDTFSAGLTYTRNSTVVKIQKKGEDTTTEIPSTGYTITEPSETNKVLTVTFTDVKAAPVNAGNGDIITVEYKATLNENAVAGNPGNPNTLVLKYSNNPNTTGNGEGEPTGTTPPVTAVVFTFKTVVNKVQPGDTEGTTKPLVGAEFSLEKLIKGENDTEDSWDVVNRLTISDDKTTFTFNGLGEGRYRLKETKTPVGFNSIETIYFTITAVYGIPDGSDKAVVTSLTVTATDKDGNALDDKDTSEFVAKFTPISDANHTNSGVSTDILNQSGSVLPSTGGIGTTIFYVVGGILVVAAGILLVTKRRMRAQ